VKVVAVIQARMGSTRLPGKVLLPLAGKPLLARMVERVEAARELDGLVIATTTAPEDQPLVALASSLGVPVYRGHPTDLIDRHLGAARALEADAVAKIPSDCPLIDPDIIDAVVTRFRRGDVDYASNLHPATYPDGNDVEVMTLAALERADREATRPHEREHTTPWLWDSGRFRVANVAWSRDLSMSHRLTIDYPEDYALIQATYEALWTASRPLFGLREILDYLDQNPAVFRLNSRYAGVNWYRHHLDELATISPAQTRVPEATL
jgi:spore coat polysaccharide biosynthesis protein SpsF